MPDNLVNILKRERLELLDKLGKIDGLIKLYQQSSLEIETAHISISKEKIEHQLQKSTLTIDRYFGYDNNQPIRKKILDIIKNESRFLHVREIANIAHHFEPNIPVTVFVKKLSPALSVLKNLPQSGLVNIEVSNSHFNTFWGSKAWLNEEGEIISKYMYNSNQLSNLNKVIYSI